MDPDDPSCPVRMQGVASPAELVVHSEDLKDAVSEDFDSPTPRITHRYPDRVQWRQYMLHISVTTKSTRSG